MGAQVQGSVEAGPLLLSIPHSGEVFPEEAKWLKGLPEVVLMCDVDRYVDRLYAATIQESGLLTVTTPWHRYVVDLNRVPSDVDPTTVVGAEGAPREHRRGFHWSVTTKGDAILQAPLSAELHSQFVDRFYTPFHESLQHSAAQIKERYGVVYHLDLHSMPSIGTSEHRDPGQRRPEICLSDSKGKSSSPQFRDLAVQAFRSAGFEVGMNWPYFGGRITEAYGRPHENHHTLQIELRRDLYMNEETKQLLPGGYASLSARLRDAVLSISKELSKQVVVGNPSKQG